MNGPVHRFNLEEERRLLLGEHGIRFELSGNLTEARSHRAIGSYANGMLSCGVHCYIAALTDAARQLTTKAKDWFEIAISEREVPKAYFPRATEAQRHSDLAMCNWLLFATHDDENLEAAINGYQQWYVGKNLNKTGVLMALLKVIDAMSYESTIELFERTPRLSAPRDIMRINNGGKMAYVIAQTRSREAYTLSEMQAALNAFLKRSILDMLTNGHYIEAARWMKIAYFNEAARPLSPTEAILKCYDFMPDVQRPDV